MKKILIFLLIFVSMAICLPGQSRLKKKILKERKQSIKERVKIDQTKPTVYIDFIKVVDNEPFNVGEPRERVYLKLVNNSKWSIYVPMFEYIVISEGTGLYYYVEIEIESKPIEGEIPQGYKKGHGITPYTELKSSKSVNFSVPNDHLADNLLIRVYFYYDWVWSSFEKEDTTNSPYPEIDSSVYFTHSMLEQMNKK